MNTLRSWPGFVMLLIAASPTLGGCEKEPTAAGDLEAGEPSASHGTGQQTIAVSGSAVHFFTTQVIHSQVPTATGMLQLSSDIIQLTGDLTGYVLYHPRSEFDFVNNTLVNTGTQFFSGTIAGSEPVILHDDQFRFEVDLGTGQVVGDVYLTRSKDAPHRGWYDCRLHIVGTGTTPTGDVLSDYSGECRRRGGSA